MLERLDWTERVALALTAVFIVTLLVTMRADSPELWVLWGIAMVLLSGSVLLIVNRSGSPSER